MAGAFQDCSNHGSFVSLAESNCKKNYNYENICQFNNLNILLFRYETGYEALLPVTGIQEFVTRTVKNVFC